MGSVPLLINLIKGTSVIHQKSPRCHVMGLSLLQSANSSKANKILDFDIFNKDQKEMRIASVTKPENVYKNRPDHEFILAQRLVRFLYIHTILRPGKIP